LKLADKWVLLLGGRYDQFHMINNVLHAPATSTDETDSAFTGRAGLVYKAANGLAPYISYTESFRTDQRRPTASASVSNQVPVRSGKPACAISPKTAIR